MNARTRQRLMRDNTLTTGARYLYGLLETYADPDGSNAFPSIETLVFDAKRNRKWIFKHLDELTDSGWVTRAKRPGKRGFFANVYTLNTCPKAARIRNENISAQNGDTNECPKAAHDQYPCTSADKPPSADNGVKKRKVYHDPRACYWPKAPPGQM